MNEKPILFSAPMVRALLDGRKTQTRRAVKYPVEHGKYGWHPTKTGFQFLPGGSDRPVCPYGKIGDELWVRETFRTHQYPCGGDIDTEVEYRATPVFDGDYPLSPWRPSIHMPRKYSRITLEITGVKVERLQDISEEDAKAEGVERHDDDGVAYYGPLHNGHVCPKYAFARLWECINGFDSWAANPWVWVIEFRRLTP